jgi:UDP-N-acetylglucosamine 4,6-dehydratase
MNRKNIAIYGAGYAGLHLLEEYFTEKKVSVICFIDDNSRLHSKKIRNIEILSSKEFISNLEQLKIDELIIAMPSASNSVVENIYLSFKGLIPSIKILPSLKSILYDKPFVKQIHDVKIESLLGRNSKTLDTSRIKDFCHNKVIMITGGGGSIGSELCRQTARYGAKKIIIIDNSEFNLYTINQELECEYDIIPILGNVTDSIFLEHVFSTYNPEIVIHAAAYKHVPMIEKNKTQGIRNNIIGTKNCIDLAVKHKVDKFIMISTDKAVRPTNVMGASKRVCELYIQNINASNTEIVAVRFGNVLGSSGSVIPKFRQQIKSGGPITVTHPEITRYFMLIPEACELVLQAGSLGKGGEIFILDMGKPIKIVDLAKKLIELSKVDNLEIEFCGLRPGEKLFEELLIDETDCSTEYNDITIANSTIYNIEKLNQDIDDLLKSSNDESILLKLKNIVPEFKHNK